MMTKIAVVTGAAGGMGKAICTRLLDDGFHVVGVDIAHNKDDDKGGTKAHLRFSAETCDLTDEGAVSALFGRIAAAHGGVDILVNNAGTCFMSDFPDIPATELKAQMAVNFESAF
jgi:NAD(P)-dependent dehydrogenase (short-subunit alcohol dehydrogenase family)